MLTNKNNVFPNDLKIFVLLSLLAIFLSLIVDIFIVSDGLYYQTYIDYLPENQIIKIIGLAKKWQWISYFLIPVTILFRVVFASTCIYVGLLFLNHSVPYSKIFHIALIADFVFIISSCYKILFLFIHKVNVLEDLQFQPLALIHLFNKESVSPIFIYVLNLINIFELFYWLIVAYFLTKLFDMSFLKSIKIVASSYGVGLFVWASFIVFVTLNFSS